MKFIKDILLFDIETTGPNPEKDSIIQISAVLLAKDNLLEQSYFNSYVRVSLLDGTIAQHAGLLGIDFETLKKSLKIYDAIKEFDIAFGKEPLLATHSFTNLQFLKNAYKKSAIQNEFDPHTIDLWTLEYFFLLKRGIKKIPTFDTMTDYFNLQQKNQRNAFERVKLSAEILRRIL